MAQRIQVLLVDDIDGTEAHETVTFGLDGVTYEIDLTDENASKLRDAMAPWVGNARRAGGRKQRRSANRASATNTTAVREWARANGFDVSDRGRISREVQEAYDKANS